MSHQGVPTDNAGEMFELRVLSGLHQGAALPLFGDQWCIGASAEADLELYDPGIEAQHAQLFCIDGRWQVQARQGLLQDECGAVLARIANLAPRVEFSIGGIRLCIASIDSFWLQEPVHVPGTSNEVAVNERAAPTVNRWKTGLICALLVLVPLAVAGGMVLPPNDVMPPPREESSASDKRQLATPAEVHQQLRKMLIERELGHQVSLELASDQITLGGEVSKESQALVSRMLARFSAQFETTVPIINQVQALSSDLPFRIVQIIGGQKAHVVLADGRRLFFGDEIDGLRLTVIDNHRLLFEGKQRYEVKW